MNRRGGNEPLDTVQASEQSGAVTASDACVETRGETHYEDRWYRCLFEDMLQGVILQDANGTITHVNPAARKMLGQSFEQLLNASSPYWQAIREDGTAIPLQQYPAMIALQTGKAVPNVIMGIYHLVQQQYCWINANAVPLTLPGETRPTLVHTVFYQDSQWQMRREILRTLLKMVQDLAGENTGMLLLLQHEKDQREKEHIQLALQTANEEIARLQKMKSNLLTTVSYEFRAALTGIQSFSEIMRDQDVSIETIKELALDIYTDSRRLMRMINDMLELDRLASGNVKLRVEWLDINAIISEIARRMHSNFSQHHLRLHLASALPILQGDAEKLSQVMSNLLRNALKYSPPGSEICVCSQVEHNMVHVSISDQGVGISAAELERIFERYLPPGKGKKCIGSPDLSLPIAREIIHMHGGKMWAESTVGKGSTFHFTVRYTEAH